MTPHHVETLPNGDDFGADRVGVEELADALLAVHEREQDLLVAATRRKCESGRNCRLPDATFADYKKEPPVEQMH